MSAAEPNPRARSASSISSDWRSSCLLVGGVGGWAATTELSGAVIAPGTIVVESNVKKVQHPTGGVVGEILVKEGGEVEAGQVVLRLDDTVTRATLGVVRSQLDELTAREARLLAERDDAVRHRVSGAIEGRSRRCVRRHGRGRRGEAVRVAKDCAHRPARAVARAHRPDERGDQRPLGPAAKRRKASSS